MPSPASLPSCADVLGASRGVAGSGPATPRRHLASSSLCLFRTSLRRRGCLRRASVAEQTWFLVVLAVGPLPALFVVVPLLSGNGAAIAVMGRLRPAAAAALPSPHPGHRACHALRPTVSRRLSAGLGLADGLAANEPGGRSSRWCWTRRQARAPCRPGSWHPEASSLRRRNRDPDQLVDLLDGLLRCSTRI